MVSFVAIYRGQTVNDARLVSISADPCLVADVASRILTEALQEHPAADPVVAAIDKGKARALALIAEARGE